MKAIKIIIIVLSLALYSSCSDTNKSEDEYGYVLFYTDAHFYMNSDQFDVDIYINEEKVGILKYPFPIGSIPDCNNNDTLNTLKLNLESGRYKYSARCPNYTTMSWDGFFEIHNDSCTIIFLKLIL